MRYKIMERPIRLTYMIDVLDTDLAGTENQLIKMINGLDKKIFQIELICLRDHAWFAANAGSLDCATRIINVHRLKSPSTYLNFFKLVSYLRRTKPDIVHTFFPVCNIAGVIAAKMAGVPGIISSRRDYGEWMRPSYLLATKFANRFADRIIANSKAVKKLTCGKEHVEDAKVDVMYNGIDAGKFAGLKRDNALKKSLNIPRGNKVVGIVANFRPMKHHHTLLRAAASLLKKKRDVSFLLVGNGPLEEELKALASELKIQDSICFAGSQGNITRYLSIMDIGVNCSEGEGLSNAIMEYMAAGLPSIVSEAGGNTDLIVNDVNGYTFQLGDHDTLCSLMTRLLDDDAARERFSRKAKETIDSCMLLDVMLSNYEVYYKRLIDARV